METLNVAAGRTDEEYKAAEDSRRAELLADSRAAADFFFYAACLSALGTGLLWLRLNFAVNVGAVDLLRLYGASLGNLYVPALYATAILWVLILVGLGAAARKGHRWPFLAGIILYGMDMVALVMMFSLLAFGVHAFFVFKWFQGQQYLAELAER